MKTFLHLIDITGFRLSDESGSAGWLREAFDALGISEDIKLFVHDGVAGELPSPDQLVGAGRGLIVSGSAGPVFEDKPWIPPLIGLLREAQARDAWMLGICFGHHALAVALGGEVGFNSRGREMGTVPVYLTEQGRNSRLFRGFESGDLVNLIHRTHITRLPDGAARLAFNRMTPTQSFRLGRAYGFQGHPELNAERMRELARRYGEVLVEKEGFLEDDEHLENYMSTFSDTPAARSILRNFVEIVSS